MNDTREIMTLDDTELDVVSGGFFNTTSSFNGNTLNFLSGNHNTTIGNNSVSVGGGVNSVATTQGSVVLGLQLIGI
jgi:hypothetical protein